MSFAAEALGTGAGATSGAGAGTGEEDVVTEGAGAGTPAADHRKSLACSVIGALPALIAAMHPVSNAGRSVSAVHAGTTTCAGAEGIGIMGAQSCSCALWAEAQGCIGLQC